MIRYLEWGESNLTAVVYNAILHSSASVCVPASPQWAPHIWVLLPSCCSSSHDSLTAQKEIDPSPKSNGKSSLPLIWQQVLREGGEEGSGWEWAKGPQFCHRDLPQLTRGIWQHFTVQWKVLHIQQPEPLILQCMSHLLFEVSEYCNASLSGWQHMAAPMLPLLSKGKSHLWLNLASETLHTHHPKISSSSPMFSAFHPPLSFACPAPKAGICFSVWLLLLAQPVSLGELKHKKHSVNFLKSSPWSETSALSTFVFIQLHHCFVQKCEPILFQSSTSLVPAAHQEPWRGLFPLRHNLGLQSINILQTLSL